jgi:hypothetical protein
VFETVARLVAAGFGGVSLAIAGLGYTALWRGEAGETPVWWGVVYGTLMLVLGIAFSVIAIWPPRDSPGRLKALVLAVEVVTGVLFVAALFHGVFGGPPDA